MLHKEHILTKTVWWHNKQKRKQPTMCERTKWWENVKYLMIQYGNYKSKLKTQGF